MRQTDDTSRTENVSSSGWFVKIGIVYTLLAVLFIVEIGSVEADGLFDFQMKMAMKGNAEAQFKVGEMYETGFGVDENLQDAELWINKAASQGHETSEFKLLYWDLEKNNLNIKNKSSFDALVSKAETENGQAMYYLGKMYANAVGVKKNTDEAMVWLNKAALQGVIEAEREAVAVREIKQKDLLKAKKAEQKRIALENSRQDKLKKEKEEKKREQDRKRTLAESNKQKQKNANDAYLEAKAKTEADERATRQSEAEAEAVKEQQRAQEKSKLQADQDAAVQKEQKRQALLKKRAAEKSAQKEKFESDPCSGKSARFLSTCR